MITTITQQKSLAMSFDTVVLHEAIFSCCCGWSGCQSSLDFIYKFEHSLICCPICKNDDVRIVN